MQKFGFEASPKPKPRQLTPQQKDLIDKALEKFVIETLTPLSIVDKPAFKAFIATLNASYPVPCAKTLTSRLRKNFEQMKLELKEELKKADFVAITHDSWTSIATQSYETVTVHYILESEDGTWLLKSNVLETSILQGGHTAEMIAEFLEGVKERWQLPEIVAVTDNASVEVKTFTVLGWTRIGCFGHLLNLIVRKLLAENTPKNLTASKVQESG